MFSGFLLRWGLAFALLALTYNPTRWNFIAWASRAERDDLPLVLLAGLLLFTFYLIYLRATLRSIGTFGMILVLTIFATALWVLWDRGLVDLASPEGATWAGLFGLSLVLGIGLSWSFVRRRLSGQFDVDDADD